MSKIAAVLGQKNDEVYFQNLADKIKKVINTYFFDEITKQYWEGRQGSNVLALAFGIVPEEHIPDVLGNLVKNIHKNKGHLDTGILATPLLLDILTKYGMEDLAFTIMNQRDFPGFGDYILGKGATTLWENWDGGSSHSHPMYGSVIRWFYQALAGIYPDENNPGFKHIQIRPSVCGDLNFATAEYNSVYGKILSSWNLDKNKFNLEIEIPENTSATVYIPAVSERNITEDGKAINNATGIEFIKLENNKAIYKVGSGKYSLSSKLITGLITPVHVSTPEISPADSLFEKPGTAFIHIKSATPGAEIYYTTDGSEPTQNSKHYNSPVELTRNATIKALATKDGYKNSYIKSEKVVFIDPEVNGLRYTVYEGEWEERPDISALKAVSSGKQYNFNLNRIKKREDYIAIVFEGYIQIDHPGLYTFYSAANDGSWLYIDNKLVVNNTGDNYSGKQNGKIRLNKGKFPIKVIYYENDGTEALNVAYKREGMDRQAIQPSMLYLNVN